MKKRLLSVAFLMGAMAANAQVGIGTANPNKSAELLIESKNRGLLIPNVELINTTDKSTITNGNVESLLVYATKKQNDVAPGYYYWHINKWERLTADSDIPQIVVNQFEDILKLDGDKVENIIKDLIKSTETLTVLAYNPATGILTYTDEKGLPTTVDVKGAVKTFETVTAISTNAAAGTITFIAEDGNPTVLNIAALVKENETVTTLVREKAGKYIYTNEAGTASAITVIGDVTEVIKNNVDQDLYNVLKTFVDVEETLTQLVYNATTKQLIFSDEGDIDHEIDVEALVKANQLVTSIASGTNITVTEVNKGNSISYTLDVPTASKEVAGVVKPGSGLDIDADGNLTVNLETALNAKDLSGNDKIVVTDGKGAVLKTTKLDINEKAIKLENLGGTLNLRQLQAGNAGDVLVVNDKGEVVWSAKEAITTNSLTLAGTDLVSTVNGVSSTETLKDKLTTEMLQDKAVTADKLGADTKDAGKVPVAQADGSVVYQNISSNNVDGKALTSANNLLTVSNAAGVVLKDVVLTVDQTKYDLAQIGGTLQLTQIEKGKDGQVLVTVIEKDADGKDVPTTKWVDKKDATTNKLAKKTTGEGVNAKTDSNTLVSTVNGVESEVKVIDNVSNNLDADNKLVTTVNGVPGTGIDLTRAIQAGQLKTTVSAKDEKVTVTSALDQDGKTTNYVVGVVEAKLNLGEMDGQVTTNQIKDGAVTPGKLEAGKDGQVLVTVVEKDAEGKDVPTTKWVDKKDATTNALALDGTDLVSTVNGVGATVDLTGKINKDMLAENVAGNGLGKNADGSLEVKAGNGITIVDNNVTVNAGTGLSFDKDGKLNVDFPNATADKAGVVKPGKGLDVATDGTLTVNYETAKTELAKGNITSNSITVTTGENSTFKNVKLEIVAGTEGQVMVTEKDTDGKLVTKWVDQLPADKLTPGNNGQVLVTEGGKTVWAEPKETVLAGDVTGKSDETVVGGIQGTPVSETQPTVDGQALVFVNGQWIPGTPNVGVANITDAKDLTTDGIILVDTDKTSSEGSLLKAAKLSIKAGGITANELGKDAVTSDKIKDGAVTPGKIDGGTDGQVLTTKVIGETKTVEWKTPVVDITKKGDLSSTTNLLTVDKGDGVVLQNVSLTVNQGNFELNQIGGTLNTTQIKAGADNQVLTTIGSGKDAKVEWKTPAKAVVVKPADGKTTGTNSNVIVTPGTGDNANEFTVDVKAAMPKVFYMPPVMFDTSKTGTGKSRNLYDEYVAMFGGTGNVVDTPITGTRPGLVANPGANGAKIPVYEQSDLNFYVAYYDPAVFENVSVSNEGVLTYDIIKKAKYGAFMTVVFVVK